MNTHTLKPIGILLKESWSLYRRHMNALALVTVIPLVFSAVGLVLSPSLAVNDGALLGIVAVAAVFNILNLIFSLVMPLAALETVNEASSGRSLDVNSAYKKAFIVVIPYLFVLLLSGIMIIGGLVLFIIPGIILNIYFIFALYVFLFEGKRGIDALVQSAWYVRGQWWNIFGRKVLLALVIIAGTLVFLAIVGGIALATGFGSAVVNFLVSLFVFLLIVPFAFCYMYTLYKDVSSAKVNSVPTPAFIMEAEKIFIILLIIPCLIVLGFFFFWNFVPHQSVHFIHTTYMNHGFLGN